MNTNDLNILYHGLDHAVICKKPELQNFVMARTGLRGIPTMVVNGTVREVWWKSIGAGLYRVGTKELE